MGFQILSHKKELLKGLWVSLMVVRVLSRSLGVPKDSKTECRLSLFWYSTQRFRHVSLMKTDGGVGA